MKVIIMVALLVANRLFTIFCYTFLISIENVFSRIKELPFEYLVFITMSQK
jgi:hypothetical protein